MTNDKTSSTSSSRRRFWIGAALVFLLANGMSGRPAFSPVEREPGGDTRFREKIESGGVEVVLLGNSMLGEGIDEAVFAAAVGRPSLKVTQGGAASAWWWVVFRHQIAEAVPTPAHVVVFFRDTYLTDPAFRTLGHYKPRIDALASAEERVLDDLAYTRTLSAGELWLRRLLPLYRNREVGKSALEGSVLEEVSELLPRARGGHRGVMARTFADENVQPELVTKRQLAAEALEEVVPPFEELLPDSFLGPMLDLAEERDIAMHFVRVKRRRDLTESQPDSLVRYVASLEAYLASRGASLHDYTDDPDLRLEHFARGDHLDRAEGRALFTRKVAEALAPELRDEGAGP